MTDRLYVHSRDGVIEVPLTGEPKHDDLLLRLAQRGGTVTSQDGVLIAGGTRERSEIAQTVQPQVVPVDNAADLPDPDEEMRRAMREDV